ncbi:MAG: Mobile element protein [uncultured Paraburkholderia sp.]|nr:MAG: Mobile element protein [uncultured Paraburkholderia sp.]
MLARQHFNVVACALANKFARIAWAIAARKMSFNAGAAAMPA